MSLPTFKSSILQTKAYRLLREKVTTTLNKFELSTPEWSVLGILYENKDGIRLATIASVLDVEAPHITNLVEALEAKNLLKKHDHPQDKRAKLLFLTSKGEQLVPQIENALQETLQKLLKGVSRSDLLSYQKVLEAIIVNSDN